MLRELQEGFKISMPDSRPMPSISRNVHELRIFDSQTRAYWRIVYRIDVDAIIIAEVFSKKSKKTPKFVIDVCKNRFRSYDLAVKGKVTIL
jgi:phage-related protein